MEPSLESDHASHQPWFARRRASEISQQRRSMSGRRSSNLTQHPTHGTTSLGAFKWFNFKLQPWDEDEEADWWFASTGVPLIAATVAPLANVMSIAALVTSWRMCLVDGVDSSSDAAICSWNGNTTALVGDLEGYDYHDPRWCYNLNVLSLVLGFIGNLFLLFNFTGRVRYIIALPVTIGTWYIATALLIGITVGMDTYDAPVRPQQTYTQGFWYAILAAILYLVCSMLLMLNMLGYFLGHYPEKFNLTESQRTLILQTMMFFIWLAGGAAVFSRVETLYGDGTYNWGYVNALYFTDVTVLTVGFGDIVCTSDLGRGLVLPYSVLGIIMLGLVISSISQFAGEIGSDNIVQKHVERSRLRTFDRSVTSEREMQSQQSPFRPGFPMPTISSPISPPDRSTALQIVDDKDAAKDDARKRDDPALQLLRRVVTAATNPVRPKRSRQLILREEKDRFDAMRTIQDKTTKWKQWMALSVSLTAFLILWCIGAVVFWQAEKGSQTETYFDALYFCYIALLTIGYGDFAPQSNAGRPFFVLWGLIAVPLMTILVSNLSDTVIDRFKAAVSVFADFTVLPKDGIWHDILQHSPWLLNRLEERKQRIDAKARLDRGFEAGPDPAELESQREPTIDELALEEQRKPTESELARKLAISIRNVAHDMKNGRERYHYEEWVEFTQLIRFTKTEKVEEDEEDLIEWDWIGEDSPMMAKGSEPEFVLDRLCESMGRYMRRLNPDSTAGDRFKKGISQSAKMTDQGSRKSIDSSTSRGRSPGDIRKRHRDTDVIDVEDEEPQRRDDGADRVEGVDFA